MLISRKEEKSYLTDTLDDEYSDFIAVYGRRRVGKTFLIRESFNYDFTFQHAGIANGSRSQQLDAFRRSIEESGGIVKETPKNWMDAFSLLKDLIKSSDRKKKVIFLDELSWMDTKRSDFMVALENFWNGWASARKDIVLIVCASATSWIIDNIIHNKGGLYNRLTREIYLRPFNLSECAEFMVAKNVVMNAHELLEGYMIFGGIPYYWNLIEKSKSLSQNIDDIFFRENAPLRNEYDYLYSSIFSSPGKYVKVIEILGKNKSGLTRSELVNSLKITSSGNFSRILKELENCGFIRGYMEFGKPEKDKKYKLIDNFTIFYFKFLKKRPGDEHFWSNHENMAARNAWCGLAFERVCMEHIPQIKKSLGITGVLTENFVWQCRSDPDNGIFGSQIDMLLVRKDQVINLCEIKYSTDDYSISKQTDESLRHKINDFVNITHTKAAIHLTLITTYGLVKNMYSGSIQNVITADDLIAKE